MDGKTESFEAIQATRSFRPPGPHMSLICVCPSSRTVESSYFLCREVALWRLLRLAFDFKGTRVGRLGCGGTRAGPLDRTGVAVASAIATSGRRPRGAAEAERQEDVAGDATARQVARVERSNPRAPCAPGEWCAARDEGGRGAEPHAEAD